MDLNKITLPIETFVAANGTLNNVYKCNLLSIEMDLSKKSVYPFYVCNVFIPMIDAEILYYFNLKPELRQHSSFENITTMNSHCIVHTSDTHSV